MRKSSYVESRVAVDTVILTWRDKKLWIFLQQREKKPFEGKLELLGGLLQRMETAEETLKRKVASLFGFSNFFCQQFYTFTQPKRDPRSRTVSIAFISLASEDKVKDWQNFWEVEKVKSLAFDHKQIVAEALKYMESGLDTWIIRYLLPKSFPLNDLQSLYEFFSKKKLDNRNFRKKMINLKVVEEVEERQKSVQHRPAKLYRFVI